MGLPSAGFWYPWGELFHENYQKIKKFKDKIMRKMN